jgi:hypothetical protein
MLPLAGATAATGLLAASGAAHADSLTIQSVRMARAIANLPAAAHLAANHDGTVCSCNGSAPQASRFASDLGVAPTAVSAPGDRAEGGQHWLGTAHCLVNSGQGATIQRYQSPYLRTAGSYVPAAIDEIEEEPNPITQGLETLFCPADGRARRQQPGRPAAGCLFKKRLSLQASPNYGSGGPLTATTIR